MRGARALAFVVSLFTVAGACGTTPSAPPKERETVTIVAEVTPELRGQLDEPADKLRPPSSVPRLAPVEGVVSLAVGDEHACVARADGRVLCWGNGETYRLGQGRREASKRPIEVPNIDRVVKVGVGGVMTCAIKQDATVLCWGGYRQLPGDEDGMRWPMVRLPEVVAHPVAWTRQVTAGWVQAALLDGAGRVSILDAYLGPVPLPEFKPAVQLASLRDGFCTRTAQGEVQCVTSSEFGASGNAGGKGGYGEEPSLVIAPLVWSEALEAQLVDAEGNEVYAVCASWDDEDSEGDEEAPAVPAFCNDHLKGATDIDAFDDFACAVLGDGGLACWGCAHCWQDDRPPVGMPEKRAGMLPFRIGRVKDAVQVAVGGRHLCTLHKDGAVRCWGDDLEGQLGPRGAGTSEVPVVIDGLGEVVEIDAGESTTCALRKDATVMCWGHVLGTELPERAQESGEEAEYRRAQEELIAKLPSERAPPDGLTGAAPAPELVCREVVVFDRDKELDETRYGYDKQGRVVTEQDSRWNGTESVVGRTTEYRYDKKGRIIQERRSEPRDDGQVYTSRFAFRYDNAGNVVWKKGRNREDDSAKTYKWDAKGRLVHVKEDWLEGRITWRERPGAGPFAGLTLHESELDSDERSIDGGWKVRFAIDASGREVYRRTRSDGGDISDEWVTYDGAGNEVLVVESHYSEPFFEDPYQKRERRYSYGPDGRETGWEIYDVEIDAAGVERKVLVRRGVNLYVGCL